MVLPSGRGLHAGLQEGTSAAYLELSRCSTLPAPAPYAGADHIRVAAHLSPALPPHACRRSRRRSVHPHAIAASRVLRLLPVETRSSPSSCSLGTQTEGVGGAGG